NGTAEAAAPEMQSAASVEPAPAETNTATLPVPAEPVPAAGQESATNAASPRRIPVAVLILAGVLVAVVIIAALLLVAARRRAAEEADEDELDWQEPEPVRTPPAKKSRAEQKESGDRKTEAPKRRSAGPVKANRKTESTGGYKPRH
ncbi:MAG: hypothetical protein J5916_11260, partial [Oscillospiraceae bacterium]|nr:hypothetical protein [Oscillospiraceae bacterium]